jgi:hypothetical protein
MPVSEIMHARGVDYAGSLAPEIQFDQTFSAAVVAGSGDIEGSKRLIEFLSSARTSEAIRKAEWSRSRPQGRSKPRPNMAHVGSRANEQFRTAGAAGHVGPDLVNAARQIQQRRIVKFGWRKESICCSPALITGCDARIASFGAGYLPDYVLKLALRKFAIGDAIEQHVRQLSTPQDA